MQLRIIIKYRQLADLFEIPINFEKVGYKENLHFRYEKHKYTLKAKIKYVNNAKVFGYINPQNERNFLLIFY